MSLHTHHDHGCGHNHGHHHAVQDKKILGWSLAVIVVFMVVEFFGGYWFGSLTLMADAGHMANDSLSLMLALVALFLGQTAQRRFALLNGASLVGVAGYVLYEAFERWQHPQPIQALPTLVVAVTGLLVNVLVAWLMLKSDRENLNIKAAYLHVLTDLFGSVVAIAATLSVWLLGWYWVDIAASIVLSVFILKSGLDICRAVLRPHNL